MKISVIKRHRRLNVYAHLLLTFVCQTMLTAMTFYELATNSQWAPYFAYNATIPILFARFICSTILHLSMVDQITGGCEMMKFAVNHPYKFNSPTLAFLAGALQFISILSIEVASIGVICAAIDTIDMIFNFIALAILADFGIYVYQSMKNESFQEMIEEDFCKDVLVIKHTTSKKCQVDELCEDEFDAEGV